MSKRLRGGCGLLLVLLWALNGWAQTSSQQLFDHLEHDFGTVARGAKAEHRFTLRNIWPQELHIASVTSSCGCTTPTVTKSTLQSLEQAELVASVDTRTFTGYKEASITVRFDLPLPSEVILRVKCHIRGDVVVTPGSLEFNSVPQGTAPERKAVVQYAGRSDWKVIALEKSNSYLDVKMTEALRTPGQVSYNLAVKLREDTPAGYIHEQLVLVTNDANPRASRVPVTVEGVVVPKLMVRPSPLMMGVVTTGQAVTKHLVVQGQTPFKIVGILCPDARFRFQVPATSESLHLVPVIFQAGSAPGTVEQKLRVQTAEGAGLDVSVHVQVVLPSEQLDTVAPVGGESTIPPTAKPPAPAGELGTLPVVPSPKRATPAPSAVGPGPVEF